MEITKISSLPEISHLSIQVIENGFIVKAEIEEKEQIRVFNKVEDMLSYINAIFYGALDD